MNSEAYCIFEVFFHRDTSNKNPSSHESLPKRLFNPKPVLRSIPSRYFMEWNGPVLRFLVPRPAFFYLCWPEYWVGPVSLCVRRAWRLVTRKTPKSITGVNSPLVIFPGHRRQDLWVTTVVCSFGKFKVMAKL